MTTKKIILTIILMVSLASIIALPLMTSAQGLKDINEGIDTTAQGAGVKGESNFIELIAMLVQILLGLIGMVFLILIIYGGFVWMTAMGIEEKVTKARKLIINAVIGLIIIMLSYSISYFIAMALENTAR